MFQVIEKPHKYNCICNECQAKAKKDELKFAKSRLNAYKGEFIKRLHIQRFLQNIYITADNLHNMFV